jgi:predicted nucleic acid-binding protein
VPRRNLLLDACVAINLAATDHLHHIAHTLAVTFLLTGQAAREVGHLRDILDGELVSTPIDLGQHRSSGNLEIIELASAEYPLYLELASIVDDGEAATIAVAVERGIQLATDDRKARRLCAERHIPEPLRTLNLIHTYTDGAGLEHTEICDLLIKIRDRASFLPSRTDPDHKWWDDHISGD